MHISFVPVGDLRGYEKNARSHSEKQVLQVAASIKDFGFTNPVLIDGENCIIAGHGRVMAAKQLGMDQVPCIRLEHLSEVQKRAYIIADNKLAMNSEWDMDMLAGELRELGDFEFDVGLTGFGDDEIKQMLAAVDATTEGKSDEDDTPEVESAAVSSAGDVWLLGKNRIMCGDSTNADMVQKLMGGGKPHLMVTDPPYGVEYDPSWRGGAGAVGKVLNDDRADWREAWALFPGEVVYVWHGEKQCSDMAVQLENSGFNVRNLIVWGKSALVMGRGNYHSQHETCWYAVKKGGTGHWQGDRKQTTLWSIDKPQKNETGHGTQKPVECMRRPIENNSLPGDEIYEPFSGSGTTLIAAQQTGRVCYAMELSENYVDVAVRRWQNFTGDQAVLESTGQTFDEVAAAKN